MDAISLLSLPWADACTTTVETSIASTNMTNTTIDIDFILFSSFGVFFPYFSIFPLLLLFLTIVGLEIPTASSLELELEWNWSGTGVELGVTVGSRRCFDPLNVDRLCFIPETDTTAPNTRGSASSSGTFVSFNLTPIGFPSARTCADGDVSGFFA